MSLSQNKFLFIDCQTTGMRPPGGQILELAWSYASASCDPTVYSRLICLREGNELPARISELTGITATELNSAPDLESVFKEFEATIDHAGVGLTSVIHYAQFEKPFLTDMYARLKNQTELPFSILCSHQLTKRLFPNLPSQNIRGASGFFGFSPGSLKRAAGHVHATHQIWRGITSELEKMGINDADSIHKWLQGAPKKKVTRYEYRLDKIKRLDLPNTPGIYRMLSKSGEVLYVGKATSLKSRVNSYFRGLKGRDTRKLEMLAQVWDLGVTACETPLEAAILESDEIKRLNPPYNVVLKRGSRHLLFYNKDFSSADATQTTNHPLGPFRNSNWIEHLRLLFLSLGQTEFEQIFFKPIPPDNLRLGFELFSALNDLALNQIKSVRSLLAQGMWLLKNFTEMEVEPGPDAEAEPESDEEDEVELSIEEVAAKFERLLRRAAAEYRRSQAMTRLLNSRILLHTKSGPRPLTFNRGVLGGIAKNQPRLRWEGLTIDDFDRMSILLSELSKYEYHIEY